MSSKCGALGWKLTRQGLLTWHTLSWAVLYWRSSLPNFVVLAFYIFDLFVLVSSSRKVKYSMPLSIVSCLWLCQCVMRHADGLKNVTRKRAGLSNSVAKSNIKFELQIFKFGIFWYLYSKGKYLGPNIEYSLEWHKDLTSSLSPLANMKEKLVRKCTGKERVISVMISTIEVMITEVTTLITRMPNVKIIQVTPKYYCNLSPGDI